MKRIFLLSLLAAPSILAEPTPTPTPSKSPEEAKRPWIESRQEQLKDRIVPPKPVGNQIMTSPSVTPSPETSPTPKVAPTFYGSTAPTPRSPAEVEERRRQLREAGAKWRAEHNPIPIPSATATPTPTPKPKPTPAKE